MPLCVLVNPGAGGGPGANAPLIDIVIALLGHHLGETVDVQTSLSAEHLGDLAGDFVSRHATTTNTVVIVACGGDGTLHEIINALVRPIVDLPSFNPPTVQLVVVPVGTANALYYSLFADNNTKYAVPDGFPGAVSDDDLTKLQSVLAFIHGATRPLSLTRTRLLSASDALSFSIVSCVVTSTSLHASILDTAEHLRKDVPRLDRFQLAARANISKWYRARARLLAPVHRYDPPSDAFIAEAPLDLDGPFTYYVSTLNVDRLEPRFRVTPLHRSHPPGPHEIDLIVMRPQRNPAFASATGASHERATSAKTTIETLQAAYEDGRHLGLRFDPDGAVTPDGDGPFVVEYYRCGGWEWLPEDGDDDAHLVCADGTVISVPQGGKAVCTMLPSHIRFIACA